MQNLEPYRAGPSEARPVGASYIPTRNHKVPYTVADDQLLWDWMQKYERDSTASISGNKIYQELAAKVVSTSIYRSPQRCLIVTEYPLEPQTYISIMA